MGGGWQIIDSPNEGDIGGKPNIRDLVMPGSETSVDLEEDKQPLKQIDVPSYSREEQVSSIATDASSTDQTLFKPASEPSKPSEPSKHLRHDGPAPGSPEIRHMILLAMRDGVPTSNEAHQSPNIVYMPQVRSDVSDHDGHGSNGSLLEDDSQNLQDSAMNTEARTLGPNFGIVSAIQDLIDKRMAVLGLRTRVRDARTNIGYHRENLRAEDATLLQELRRMDILGALENKAVLITGLQLAQTARESILELENESNELEVQLDREEWGLKVLETRVYEMLVSAKDTDLSAFTRIRSLTSGPPSDDGVLHDSGTAAPDYLGILEDRWLSRKGDVDILEEQLHTLRQERAHYIEEERTRQRFGMGLDAEGRQFLDTFDERHGDLLADLQRAQEDLADLKDAVAGQDDLLFHATQFETTSPEVDELLNNAPNPTVLPLLEPEIPQDVFHGDVTIENLQSLLDQGAQTSRFEDIGQDVSVTVVNMPSFINEWLLLFIRRSFLQVRYLWDYLDRFKPRNSEQSLTEIYSEEHLTYLVLKYWTIDATARVSRLAREAEPDDEESQSEAGAAQYTTRSVQSESAIHKKDRLLLRFSGAPNPMQNVSASLYMQKISRMLKPISLHPARSA